MSKQEEIRLEVAGIITDVFGCRRDKAEHLRTEIIDYLHSQGVAIAKYGFYSDLMEPLIEEATDGR